MDKSIHSIVGAKVIWDYLPPKKSCPIEIKSKNSMHLMSLSMSCGSPVHPIAFIDSLEKFTQEKIYNSKEYPKWKVVYPSSESQTNLEFYSRFSPFVQ